MAETSKLLQLDEPLRWRLPLQHVVTKATVTTATATAARSRFEEWFSTGSNKCLTSSNKKLLELIKLELIEFELK